MFVAVSVLLQSHRLTAERTWPSSARRARRARACLRLTQTQYNAWFAAGQREIGAGAGRADNFDLQFGAVAHFLGHAEHPVVLAIDQRRKWLGLVSAIRQPSDHKCTRCWRAISSNDLPIDGNRLVPCDGCQGSCLEGLTLPIKYRERDM